ncbi:hypothetical protein KYY02_17005 [Streptomyces pimonensis]|uniref:Uncharacterized protein n=1 Tax=Streptomyces pimonensis TaxID=2860288 RepID=A0ABV4J069_9ACTN
MSDEHVQHTWNLVRDADGDEISIDLLTDGETVQVDGGDGESYSAVNARRDIEEQLLPKYTGRGYRVASAYAVNDPEPHTADEAVVDDAEPDGRPERCPECGSPVEYEPRHCTDLREGEAWLCTGCRWGRFVTA